MAISDFTGKNIQDTYQRVVQTDGTNRLADGTGSIFIPISASHAISASYAVSASHEITLEISSSYAQTASMASDNFIVQGHITASGNISASGDIIGDGYLTIIKNDGTPAVFTLNSPNDGFGRPFTITNNGVRPTINAQDVLDLTADDGNVTIELNASGEDKIVFSTTPTGGGSSLTERYKIDHLGNHFFSSNISASGEIKTDSHISASGNISSS